jgi:hypothetical protein
MLALDPQWPRKPTLLRRFDRCHASVAAALSPLLDPQARTWLKGASAPIALG